MAMTTIRAATKKRGRGRGKNREVVEGSEKIVSTLPTPSSVTVGERQGAAAQYLSDFYHAIHLKKEGHAWKFQKIQQLWILDNIMKRKMIDDGHFAYALLYFRNIKGNAREALLDRIRITMHKYQRAKSSRAESKEKEKEYKKIKKQRKRAKLLSLTLAEGAADALKDSAT